MKCIYTALLLLLLATGLFADSLITFNTLPSTVENGTYNGFVGATIDGLNTKIICNDFDHVTYVPSGPSSFVLSTLPDVSQTRFQNEREYDVAAYLLFGDGNTLAGLENITD